MRVERVEVLEQRRLLTAEVEPNDLLASATAFVGPSDTLTGRIDNVNDVDHFATTLSSGDTLQFRFGDTDFDSSPAFGPTMEFLNSSGEVKASSVDSHTFSYTVAQAGTYSLRLAASNVFGLFTDSYSISATVQSFNGIVEVESNNTSMTATALTGETNFRGSLANSLDVDFFSFNGVAGQAIVVKFAEKPALNPALRLYSPSGSLLATDRSGLGLSVSLAETGTYTFSMKSDNNAGTVTGAYVGHLLQATEPTLDAELGNGFDSATALDLGPSVVAAVYLSPDATFNSSGLTGSYINQSLRGISTQSDWRITQTVAGTRLDPQIHFPQNDWGNRAALSLTHGTDNNWDDFSVQWDGYIRIMMDGVQVYSASDDGSRTWIDLNGDGVFNSSGSELLNNNWGNGQGNALGPASIPLVAGDYRIRIQYEDGNGDNNAYLLWNDAVHSAGAVSRNNHQDGVGTLSSLSDIDVYAVNFSGTGFYELRLESTAGAVATQNRLLTLYNEFGQPLESSTNGRLATDRHNTRPETSSRYFITVEATNETGLGSYELIARIDKEFPTYRDIPLFYQDYSTYDKPAQIPEFLAFFESRYDIYQVDLTQSNPGSSSEHVDWTFTKGPPGSGSGGVAGGGFGDRRASGGGTGSTDADWNRLFDIWFGLFYHENGHGVGLPHARQPLAVMSYGGQYDYFPVGSFNRIGGDGRVPTPKLQNERNYLDWALEAGRVVPEDESNDDLVHAQRLNPFFAEMTTDLDPRNDQVVVVGSLATSTDTDVFRFTVAANETYAIDIDSAEFQYSLDSRLEILNSSGTVLASNQGAIDRDTGLASVDPYLVHQFATAGDYYVRVRGELGTVGNYRLKITPERAFDQTGPRVAAAWPDGGSSVDGTRQLVFWFNDQLDPATLTSNNIVVQGQSNGTRAGTAAFDPITSTLTWKANIALPPDTYTITLRSGSGGITDLRGNPLDGETDGILNFPDVSGNGTTGGNFTSTFTVTQVDTTPATVTSASAFRHQHDRDMFELFFDDELDVLDIYSKTFTLRGAGPDHSFNTGDDTFSPVDVVYDRISNTVDHLLRVYSRGVLDPDTYRVEASLLDAVGNTVSLSQTFEVAGNIPANALFTTTAKTTGGLIGSYVNASLRGYAPQDDWRTTQTISGTRNDPMVGFYTNSFGPRNQVNVTGGTDADWDNFSVQWDGVVVVPANGVRLFTRSDDGSRMWVDINGDGVFNSSGSEFINNNWGNGQGATTSPASVALNAGTYRIRVQYEEGVGGNSVQLMWDSAGGLSTVDGLKSNPQVVDVSVQPNTVLTTPPASIDVTFSQSIAIATLTTSSFRVRHSPDPTFFDTNDTYLTESDGAIAWSPTLRKATFQPTGTFANGYYLIELDGDAGGITSLGGRLLDGEYRDTNISGNVSHYGWNDSPSGDGRPGGDYRAFFSVSVPGFTITQPGGTTSVNENGTTGSFTVVLDSPPLSDVVITVSSGDIGEAIISPATLTFAPADWSTPKTVTVTGVDDFWDDGDQTTTITLSIDDPNSDNTFDNVANQTISVTTVDDDTPGFKVTQSGDNPSVNESSTTDTFDVVLTAQPTSDVVITVTSGDTGEATVGPITLTFTSANWDVPQLVTVTGVDDLLIDGNQTTSVTLSVDDLNSDDAFDSLPDQTISAITLDNDAPGFTVTQTAGSTSVGESGTTDTVNVVLNSQPTSNVIILVNSSDTGEATVSAAALTFTPANWSTAQTVTVTGVADSIVDGDQTSTITLSIDDFNSDDAFDSLPNQTVNVITTDNDSAVFSVANSSAIEGNVVVFTITLSNPVEAATSVTVTTSNGSATLADSDYAPVTSQVVDFPAGVTSRTITVNTTSDSKVEADETFTIMLGGLVTGGRNLSISSTSGSATGAITDNDSAVFSVTSSSGDEDIGVTFTITLSNPVDVATSVTVTTSDGSATLADSDYVAVTSQVVNFAAGVISRTITVNTTTDSKVELDETFTATLGGLNANGRSVAISGSSGSATGTITNDDSALFSIADSSAIEGNGVAFTISLSNPVEVATSVTVTTSNGSATLTDSDYTAVTSQVVNFAAGVTSRTITVNTTTDSKIELDETFTATLGGLNANGRSVTISGSNGSATGTITNDDSALFSIANSSAIEGNGVVFTISLSNPVEVATSVTITTSNGSATLTDSDYTAVTSQVVNFAAGLTSRTVTVNTTADNKVEADEIFMATLGGLNSGGRSVSISGASGSAAGTIANDDATIFSIADAAAIEGNGITFTITLSNPVDVLTSVTFSTANGTATLADNDYSSAVSQVVLFAAGVTSRSVVVNTTPDSTAEPDETLDVTMGGLINGGRNVSLSGTNGSATGSIINNDFDVTMTIGVDRLAEDVPGALTYSLSRTGGTSLPLTVRLRIDGSAIFGFDYSQTGASPVTATSAFVTFASGASTANLQIDPIADTVIEPDETVELTLLTDMDYNVAGSASLIGTLLNDDQRVNLISSTTVVREDGTERLVYSFERTGSIGSALSVPFAFSGSATINADYVPSGDATFTSTGGSLTFAPGATTAVVRLTPAADSAVETNEVVVLTFPANAASGLPTAIVTTGTIIDDDANVLVAVSPSSVTEQGPGNLVYTFHRFGDASNALTINFSVGGSATFDTDYTSLGAASFTATGGTVTFAAGAQTTTVTLDPTPDELNEPNESGILTVLPGPGCNPIGSPATGTILNQVNTRSVSVSPVSVLEGGSTKLVYTFTRGGNVSHESTMSFTVGGTATYLTDYSQTGATSFSATAGSVTFGAGVSTAKVTLTPLSDFLIEENESVSLTIVPDAQRFNVSGTGVATGTITNAAIVSLAVSPSSVAEDGTPNLLFTFTRGGPTTKSLTVSFQVSGSATFGTDYTQTGAKTFTASSGTITFAAGEATKTITINPVSDLDIEADESVILTLSPGDGYVLGGGDSATGLIANDELDIGNVVSLDALGNLRVVDSVGRNDRLRIVKNSSNELVITDSANRLTTNVGRLVNSQEVRVPLSSIPGRALIVELNGGTDNLNLSSLAAGLLNITVNGGAGNDTILGSAGNDTLIGGEGNDSIKGGAGNDGLVGDAGNDTLDGGAGNDTILGGADNDSLLGGIGNDRIVGQEGSDRVFGQTGVDRIAGGTGSGRDAGDIVSDLTAEIDEAFSISFDGSTFVLN